MVFDVKVTHSVQLLCISWGPNLPMERGTSQKMVWLDIEWLLLWYISHPTSCWVFVGMARVSTRSPAVAEGPREHTISSNMAKCCTKCLTDCTWKRLQLVNDLQGHFRSLTPAPFDRPYMISYWSSIERMSLSGTVFEILILICQTFKWFGVIRGHPRSSAMPPFGRAHTTSY